MTCPSCTQAQTNPRSAQMTSGCKSCEGRALAAMGFTAEEVAGKHLAEVLAAYEKWLPMVKRGKP